MKISTNPRTPESPSPDSPGTQQQPDSLTKTREGFKNTIEKTATLPPYELGKDLVFMIPVSDHQIMAEPTLDSNGSNFTLKPEFHISVLTLDKAKLLKAAVERMATEEQENHPTWLDKTREMTIGFWRSIQKTLSPENFTKKEDERAKAAETAAKLKAEKIKAREKELLAEVIDKINVMLNRIDWSFQFTDEAYHIERDRNGKSQKTVIQKVNVPGIATLYQAIKTELGIDLWPLPFPHITLYLEEGDKMGIGISSEEDFRSFKPQPVDLTAFRIKKTATPLASNCSLEDMKNTIPEISEMEGFDQQNRYHALTLLDHTATMVDKLEEDEFVKNHPKKDLFLLAAKLHDIGKTAPKASTLKEDGTKNYPEQDKFNNLISRKILKKYFDLNEEDSNFILKLIGLSTNGVLESFKGKEEIKSSDLQAFVRFLENVDELPGDSLEEKVEIVMHFNLADKAAHYNKTTKPDNDHDRFVIENTDNSMAELRKLQKAFPAIIEAVQAKEAGNQKAAVQIIDGKYTYVAEPKKKEKPTAQLDPALDTIVKGIEDLNLQKRVAGILASKGEDALPTIKKWIGPDLSQEIVDNIIDFYTNARATYPES